MSACFSVFILFLELIPLRLDLCRHIAVIDICSPWLGRLRCQNLPIQVGPSPERIDARIIVSGFLRRLAVNDGICDVLMHDRRLRDIDPIERDGCSA